MADSLKIQNLSLNDSQHAPNGPPAANGRSAYIPPHLRGRGNVNPGPGPSPMDGAGPAGPTPAGAWGGNAYVLTCFVYRSINIWLK
jgi:ATP-dependent RNA helicase DDX3X